MDKKPEALSATFFDVKAKLKKVAQLGITPDMSQEAQDVLVEKLSLAKALADDSKIADHRNGQAWYIESLVEFSGLDTTGQFEHSYQRKFAESASEDEMLDDIESYKKELAGEGVESEESTDEDDKPVEEKAAA